MKDVNKTVLLVSAIIATVIGLSIFITKEENFRKALKNKLIDDRYAEIVRSKTWDKSYTLHDYYTRVDYERCYEEAKEWVESDGPVIPSPAYLIGLFAATMSTGIILFGFYFIVLSSQQQEEKRKKTALLNKLRTSIITKEDFCKKEKALNDLYSLGTILYEEYHLKQEKLITEYHSKIRDVEEAEEEKQAEKRKKENMKEREAALKTAHENGIINDTEYKAKLKKLKEDQLNAMKLPAIEQQGVKKSSA